MNKKWHRNISNWEEKTLYVNGYVDRPCCRWGNLKTVENVSMIYSISAKIFQIKKFLFLIRNIKRKDFF